MKDIIVIFTENNARILEGQKASAYFGRQDCLINPKIPQGIPPHHWKLEKGKIVEMSSDEKALRDSLHKAAPIPPFIPPLLPKRSIKLVQGVIISVITILCMVALKHLLKM
jgi:hypothetical protein